MAEPRKYNILLVDDDRFLLDMYARKFTTGGYAVAASSSSEDALERLRNGFRPDIIVLDIVMGSMNGLEFLRKIRKDNLVPEAAVIVLTNQSSPDEISEAKSLRADGYIVKATTIPSEVLQEVNDIFKYKKK